MILNRVELDSTADSWPHLPLSYKRTDTHRVIFFSHCNSSLDTMEKNPGAWIPLPAKNFSPPPWQNSRGPRYVYPPFSKHAITPCAPVPAVNRCCKHLRRKILKLEFPYTKTNLVFQLNSNAWRETMILSPWTAWVALRVWILREKRARLRIWLWRTGKLEEKRDALPFGGKPTRGSSLRIVSGWLISSTFFITSTHESNPQPIERWVRTQKNG